MECRKKGGPVTPTGNPHENERRVHRSHSSHRKIRTGAGPATDKSMSTNITLRARDAITEYTYQDVRASAECDAWDAAERTQKVDEVGGCTGKTLKTRDVATHRLRLREPQPERNPEGHGTPRRAKRKDRDRSGRRTDRDVEASGCNYAERKPREKGRPAA